MEDLIKKAFLIILLFNSFWPKIEIKDDVFHLAYKWPKILLF